MKIFSSLLLTLLITTNMDAQSPKYDRSKMKIWTCKDVDTENWKAIDEINKIPVGGCIVFFFESQEKIKNPNQPFRWKIYRMDEKTGKEIFKNQKEQTTVLPEFRRMYFEECQEFDTPGKYVIYFNVKNDADEYYGVIDKDYMAKTEITVE